VVNYRDRPQPAQASLPDAASGMLMGGRLPGAANGFQLVFGRKMGSTKEIMGQEIWLDRRFP